MDFTACLSVCLVFFPHDISKTNASRITKFDTHTHTPRWVLEAHVFWGQKVKGQCHESQIVPAWVVALLWVLASSSLILYMSPRSAYQQAVVPGRRLPVFWTSICHALSTVVDRSFAPDGSRLWISDSNDLHPRNSKVTLRKGLPSVSDQIAVGRNDTFGYISRGCHQNMLHQLSLDGWTDQQASYGVQYFQVQIPKILL